MPKIYTHSPNSLRPKRQSAEDALETPEDEVYSYPQDTNIPTRIKVEEIGDSDNFVYSFGNGGRPSRVKGKDSAFVPPAVPMILKIDTTRISGSAPKTITFAIDGQVTVNWGDGQEESISQATNHTYQEDGEYTITVLSTADIFSFGSLSAARGNLINISQSVINFGESLTELVQWGTLNPEQLYGPFAFTDGVIVPDFIPNTTTYSEGIFRYAENIPNNITQWDVSGLEFLLRTFAFSDFNKDIGSWVLNPEVNIGSIFQNVPDLSPENYSRTLIGWANNIFDRGGVVTIPGIGADGVFYSTDTFGDITGEFNNAVDARDYLVNTLGWTITDAGTAPIAIFEGQADFEADTTLTTENTVEGDRVYFTSFNGMAIISHSSGIWVNQNGVWVAPS